MLMIKTIPMLLARGKLTYYNEIQDQLHYTTKDVIIKADGISAEIYNFKEDKEVLENEVMNCDVEKVKTDPDEVEDEEFKKVAFLKLLSSNLCSVEKCGFVQMNTVHPQRKL